MISFDSRTSWASSLMMFGQSLLGGYRTTTWHVSVVHLRQISRLEEVVTLLGLPGPIIEESRLDYLCA